MNAPLPSSGSDPDAARRQQAWAKLEQAIADNPIFAVETFDGLGWIEPFTGALIPTPFGRVAVAREHFRANLHWHGGRTKPLAELHAIRWYYYLRERVPRDPRLRMFNRDNGQWLNPQSAMWDERTVRRGEHICDACLRAMAVALVRAGAVHPDTLMPHSVLLAGVERSKLIELHLPGADLQDDGDEPIIADEDDFDSALPTPASSTAKRQAVGSNRISRGTAAVNAPVAHPPQAGSDSSSANAAAVDDLDRARAVQQRMLAKVPDIDGYDLAIHYQPYDAIGGDFYEARWMSDSQVFVMIGDVSGHGVQAALVTSSLLRSLRHILEHHSELTDIISQLNASAREDCIPGQFVTMWAAILDLDNHQIDTLCAGHHPALLANPNKDVILERIGASGPALGLMDNGIFSSALEVTRYQLEPGDVLFQYTDGLSEIQDADSNEYGDLRVVGQMIAHLDQDATVIVDRAAELAYAFAGASGADDDVTALAMRFCGTGG
ncbi:MAG: PP2C family protein-serine/threonine phosphatase [Planctomycetota bacterium]|jgi:hypothetical protein